MIIYGKYGGAALRAVHIMVQYNHAHAAAWDMAIYEAFGDCTRVQKFKNNPKVTFLTLCSLGAISCVMPIRYSAAAKTKKYVVSALGLLSKKDRVKPICADDLWAEVMSDCQLTKPLKHNNQMDVILTLWYSNMLNLDEVGPELDMKEMML
ncbi:DUF6979 family protein [Aeromonas lusitana]|uniref:Uncharacterized protein n=1 Tax=Aeromonas lusitana TaxID=931529 RepID=A0A2M8H6E0_9GAMM|nr:hypothetical protein [Aeromonas lusitana]PJC92102.1 hypothetical protein CUC44_16405 [Aeromonas lusitana]